MYTNDGKRGKRSIGWWIREIVLRIVTFGLCGNDTEYAYSQMCVLKETEEIAMRSGYGSRLQFATTRDPDKYPQSIFSEWYFVVPYMITDKQVPFYILWEGLSNMKVRSNYIYPGTETTEWNQGDILIYHLPDPMFPPIEWMAGVYLMNVPVGMSENEVVEAEKSMSDLGYAGWCWLRKFEKRLRKAYRKAPKGVDLVLLVYFRNGVSDFVFPEKKDVKYRLEK